MTLQEVTFMAAVDGTVKAVTEVIEMGKFKSKRGGNAVNKHGKSMKEGYTNVMSSKLQEVFEDGRKLASHRPFRIYSKSRDNAVISSYWKCSHNMSIAISCPWQLFRTGADLTFEVSTHNCSACKKENEKPLTNNVEEVRKEVLAVVEKHINDFFNVMTARAGTGLLEKVLESSEELSDSLKKIISDAFRETRERIIDVEAYAVKNALQIQREHHKLPSTSNSSAPKATAKSGTEKSKPTKAKVLTCNEENLPDEIQLLIGKVNEEEIPAAEDQQPKDKRRRRNAID